MAISSQYLQPCEQNTGGLSKIFISDVDNVSTFTLVGDEYTSVSMTDSNVFFKHEFEQDTATMRENASRESRSAVITHEVEFYLTKLSTVQRNAIQSIIDSSTCGVIVIAQDANGQKWVIGYSESQLLDRPLRMTSVEGTTSPAFADDNGSTIILASTDTELARVFIGSVHE